MCLNVKICVRLWARVTQKRILISLSMENENEIRIIVHILLQILLVCLVMIEHKQLCDGVTTISEIIDDAFWAVKDSYTIVIESVILTVEFALD